MNPAQGHLEVDLTENEQHALLDYLDSPGGVVLKLYLERVREKLRDRLETGDSPETRGELRRIRGLLNLRDRLAQTRVSATPTANRPNGASGEGA